MFLEVRDAFGLDRHCRREMGDRLGYMLGADLLFSQAQASLTNRWFGVARSPELSTTKLMYQLLFRSLNSSSTATSA
jgi:hypothetical protein